MDRQSSLPSSLIPHLYSAPRNSSTRTTLTQDDDHHPFYPDPPFNFPPLVPPRTSWREGEAGPSSLIEPSRPAHYPTRVPPHFDSFGRRNPPAFEHESSFADLIRRDQDRDSYFSFSNSQSSAYATNQSSHHFQPLPPLIPPLDEPSFSFDRHDAYSSYPPMGSLSLSAPSSAHVTSPESPDIHSTYRSDTRSLDFGSNDDESSHKGKRRRQQSLDTDDNSRKSRNPRKTAVACNFCRGRKLRCNGTKPSCYNCTVRNFECEYVPVQRRRGPGKAPKGSRSKKAAALQTQASQQPTTSRTLPAPPPPPNPVPDYELEALAPELRPYTSVLSLDNSPFGFRQSDYPPPPPPPDPRLIREYYYSRSRETSSEDRSDAEDMFRKLS